MPSLDAIAIFAQVAQLQSFSEAARALGMPLSSVSRKVSELEADLNAHLIDRSKRQIRLTEAGASYLELCRKGLDTLTFANRVMSDRHSNTTGTITITVPPNLVEELFLEAIEAFQLQYPKARVRVLVSERLLDFVDDGVDLSFRVAPPDQPDLKVRTLLRYRHRLVAAPHYAAANPLPRAFSDLTAHKLIGFGFHKSPQVTWTLTKGSQSESARIDPDLSINDYVATRAAILAGHGIGELPEPLCKTALKDGQLVEVLPDWRFPEIKLFSVHSGNAALSKLARLFLETINNRLKV